VACLSTWWRVPGDNLLSTNTLDDRDLRRIASLRLMHVSGLVPALVLKWFQISVLAAVGVALSTRVSLVVNLPVVIFVYIAGNLTRFLFPTPPNWGPIGRGTAHAVSTVLPFLANFDLNSKTVYELIKVGEFANDPTATPLSAIWVYVLLAALYAVSYSFFALTGGLLLFQNRELGGAEG
jgi:hypothetical protein